MREYVNLLFDEQIAEKILPVVSQIREELESNRKFRISVGGMQPSSILLSLIYLVALQMGFHITQETIYERTGKTGTSLRKGYCKILKFMPELSPYIEKYPRIYVHKAWTVKQHAWRAILEFPYPYKPRKDIVDWYTSNQLETVVEKCDYCGRFRHSLKSENRDPYFCVSESFDELPIYIRKQLKNRGG